MTVIINGTNGVTSVNGSAAAPSVTGTDTDTGIVYGTNTLSLATGGTTALTANSSQGIQVLNAIGVGNTTPSTSGAGITFPATQSASTDANTLDDYEEGTWSPAYSGGTTNPTVTYAEQYGKYTKIGNVVYFSIRMVTSAVSGGSGQLRVSLPFTTFNGATGVGGGVFINFGYNFTLSGGFAGPTNGYIVANSSFFILKPDFTGLTELQVANLSASCYFNATGFFYV